MIKENFKRVYSLILLVIIMIGVQSCFKSQDSQEEIDEKKIKKYITENNINATRHETGIYYVINEEGTGDSPNLESNITFKYKGCLLNGTVFDQTDSGKSVTFKLNELIPGWQVCIPMLKPGGKGTFIIPSYLAYGPYGAGQLVGPNETLIFDIELISFE